MNIVGDLRKLDVSKSDVSRNRDCVALAILRVFALQGHHYLFSH
jgi:hypothetical protein